MDQNTELFSRDLVTISKSEYQSLLQASNHLNKLKESLLNGGLSQETLNILIYDTPPCPPSAHKNVKGRSAANRAPRNENSASHNERLNGKGADEEEDVMTDSHSDEKDDYGESSGSTESFGQNDQRTVLIRGLPDRATHKDIAQAVRGGPLLHIYLRAREHSASVSFVDEAPAQEFLQHTKAHGLYVAGKRVEALWNDRQFYLPPYVRAKINNGATRNLAIYNVHPHITEAVIREDLEHIHNLIVISVKFKRGNAFISTNSVHNALFARSCMMSRFKYKGMRISFYPDECREQFAKMPVAPKKELPVSSRNPISVPNRFHLLFLDGAEDDESGDHHDGVSINMNDNICWTDNSVSA
ncbi:hypothetical protein P175DRAFT_0296936 [Aspergillus ochraceoroseus IBT 24754]|uniref:RRM domain-containing protein n=2 Tax=Aspergillus ochraceoroseus TaxID=138278 RepID=A0A2T5LSP4_9EURO|nr:uncharacterized protein P175DRAFT_0296936 [Aspergillus ochraceoroseus IBT 24754]KKK17035.1 hypothetical protein AOCH_006925 [Aspergillus ochraceoroseus]PTU19307.1 hypothetical protein P175DRAFT_0296936 [Aspergillus ochraceoroseus IBT 24754]